LILKVNAAGPFPLSHTGTLTETHVERIDFRLREWLRVVG
jgi:hypothetical protein